MTTSCPKTEYPSTNEVGFSKVSKALYKIIKIDNQLRICK
jgi:hypothetical protein